MSGTAVWYHSGLPPVPIRWLVVKEPNGQFPPQALLSTDETITPKQMRTYFIQRWTVTTPLVLAVFAIVALLADTLHKKTACRARQTAWYRKTNPTFSDALAWVRKHLWHHFSMSTPPPDRQKPTTRIVERLIDIVSYAT